MTHIDAMRHNLAKLSTTLLLNNDSTWLPESPSSPAKVINNNNQRKYFMTRVVINRMFQRFTFYRAIVSEQMALHWTLV